MTARGRALLIIALSALYTGLSLGGRMFYLAAVFALLALACSLAAVLAVRFTLSVSCRTAPQRVLRGDKAQLRMTIHNKSRLPVSPLLITAVIGETEESRSLALKQGRGSLELNIPAPHIGETQAGVARIEITDILGLFRIRKSCRETIVPLLVLPRSFEVEPLRFFQNDEGRSLQNRTTEDLSSPEDTRAYRAGDPLKRVHWKLTARKRELVVRKFETPAPPDTLILLDCTAPSGVPDRPDAQSGLRDTLCETALSVAEMQARGDTPVRMPLYGERMYEFLSDRGGNTAILAEMLARQTFEGGIEFFRVLNMELRRMRRTGATVIITSQLNAGVVEGVKHIRRMGPSARVYYITHTPDAPADRPYIAQLQQSLVEVCYVTPA
ncbi:MAG: DUF58 domain-containing protein [Clostridia bacterium]|nr:DUF58 domain-containing protein [Clostridia bacterium]